MSDTGLVVFLTVAILDTLVYMALPHKKRMSLPLWRYVPGGCIVALVLEAHKELAMNRIEEIRQKHEVSEYVDVRPGETLYSGDWRAQEAIGVLLAEIDRLNAVIEEIRPQAQEE